MLSTTQEAIHLMASDILLAELQVELEKKRVLYIIYLLYIDTEAKL
jgi:hypothetical protein